MQGTYGGIHNLATLLKLSKSFSMSVRMAFVDLTPHLIERSSPSFAKRTLLDSYSSNIKGLFSTIYLQLGAFTS